MSQIFFISNFWSNLGQIRPIYIKWHISRRVDLHGSVFMFKRSISIGVSDKPNTFPWKFFIFQILILKNGRYASPIFDEKSRLFDFEATFLDFESFDRSDIAYYASLKWVEAFAQRLKRFWLFKQFLRSFRFIRFLKLRHVRQNVTVLNFSWAHSPENS